MNERIAQYRDRVTQYWNQFSNKQKIMLTATVVFVLIALVVLTMQFSKTKYEVAFRDLNSSDAAGIISHLESQSISYKLSPDGRSISVPSTEAARVQIDVGSQGLVQNGTIGFETFEQNASAIGMTDNEFEVKYVNALNGEVERLLEKMQGVQDATVLLNLPKESVFAKTNNEDQASASVVLHFKPGYRPNQEVIDGYYNLVKTAIPSLPIENITITNDEVELLATAKGGQGGLIGRVEENFALQKKFESEVRQNVQQFLSQYMGSSKVNVLVASKLNFDQVQSKENLVTPVDEEEMKGIELSVQEIQKNYTGTSSPAGGVAGVGEEAVPGYPSDSESGQTTSEETSSTINYEVNRITKDIIASPYTVKDLTINVAVEPPAGQQTLDEDTRTAIQNILINIVRASLADSGTTYTDAQLLQKVSVNSQVFNVNPDVNSKTVLSQPVLWGIGIAALALIAGGTYFFIRKRRRQQEEFEEDIPLPPVTEFPSINLESVTNESQVRKQLETLAKKKPDEFVNLLRTWLAEE
ncbi:MULTISPECIES: flagellar basal-body MS-ring/collar protein FliF [Paenibacillus]|uniref:Flagellar M-ring protein n=2 Tax=Paenibacillus lactis TaxID=228574 RepID=G4HBQ2_9BACL|nr:flagellar basal-body MS-ring/collar protein FliF [Paenibacillus lactis]EHB67361.1 flagellar M-ring protein FliF [Paenibacillus lactis 154]MBP1894616.1 flagellar M-ring protein FliF [Paenibacillus lactis]MCM3496006.1 flagellar M-ring protein FliF [Paenibacillus lactis]GIO93289.1 flagellar M-ring protein [Paenibacillus lactis]HAF98536.1 flagellar basal body M-ring protein FliF [Paenibacillus lactis]